VAVPVGRARTTLCRLCIVDSGGLWSHCCCLAREWLLSSFSFLCIDVQSRTCSFRELLADSPRQQLQLRGGLGDAEIFQHGVEQVEFVQDLLGLFLGSEWVESNFGQCDGDTQGCCVTAAIQVAAVPARCPRGARFDRCEQRASEGTSRSPFPPWMGAYRALPGGVTRRGCHCLERLAPPTRCSPRSETSRVAGPTLLAHGAASPKTPNKSAANRTWRNV
jgi:hypothetical protein